MKKGIVKGVILLLLGIVVTACHKDIDYGAYEEEVMENAQQVMANVSAIFEMAESIGDMSQHLDEIKAMENVEDAWQEDCSIGVKIRNGGVITWNFFNDDTTENDLGTSFLDNTEDIWAKGDYTIGICEKKTACILIGKVIYSKKTVDTIKKYLTEKGYSVSIVSGKYFSPHFICNTMPNYGVNIILAHGGYNAKTGTHRIVSGVEYKEVDTTKIFDDWIDNGLEIAVVKEFRNGKDTTVYYLAVTERLMKKNMTKQFPKNSLMFASVCSTLKGNDSLSRFLVQNKKLGCFLGYDGVVYPERCDEIDLKKIMEYMLNGGCTVRTAFAKVGSGTNPKLKMTILPSRDVALVGCNCNENGDWVDLGLPSGLLWATRNVGASSPTGYGNYYAWGETSPKSTYTRENYRYWYYNSTNHGYLKYTESDGLATLQPVDDAATVNYGGRTPTRVEWEELINNTTSIWMTIYGVSGRCFTGSNGNSLFLPAASAYSDYPPNPGSVGFYWSSTLYPEINENCPVGGGFDPDTVGIYISNRWWGSSVRAVRQP